METKIQIVSENGVLVFGREFILSSEKMKKLLDGVKSHYTTDTAFLEACIIYRDLISNIEDRTNVSDFKTKKNMMDYMGIQYSIIIPYIESLTDNNLLHFYCYLRGMTSVYAEEFVAQICKYQIGLNVLDLLGSDRSESLIDNLVNSENVDELLISYAIRIHDRISILLENIPKSNRKFNTEYCEDYGGVGFLAETFMKILEFSLQKQIEISTPSLCILAADTKVTHNITKVSYKIREIQDHSAKNYSIILESIAHSISIECDYRGCIMGCCCGEFSQLNFDETPMIFADSYVDIVTVINTLIQTKNIIYLE